MHFEEVQGERIPKIGLGTWALRGSECHRAVVSALEMGYRHLDTAEMYANEAEVGQAIADSGVDRGELFVVSKVRSSHLGYEDVVSAGRRSLRLLGLDVIDLYLVHWPNSQFPIEQTMRGMNELIEQGISRLIGVSNFSVAELDEAQAVSQARLFTNQVPYYIGRPQTEMLEYCRQQELLLTAYSPLAKGRLAGDRRLAEIAQRHQATPAQVALRWLIEQDKVVTIPKSAHPARQMENLDVFGFELSDDDRAALAAAGNSAPAAEL